MIAPILEEIASEQQGKLAIAKLNVDDNPDIARRYDVMSIPTLLVFKDGEQVKRLVGAKGKGAAAPGPRRVHRLSDPAVLRPGSQRRGGPRPPGSASARWVTRSRRDELGDVRTDHERAVRAFQEQRGLRVDGICGPRDLDALVESGYRLGDRLLYRRRPDAARRRRRRAPAPAQRARLRRRPRGRHPRRRHRPRAAASSSATSGSPTDGMCGRRHRCARRSTGSARWPTGSVASVREREALRRGPHRLEGRRVFVAAAPGFETLANLRGAGPGRAGARRAVLDAIGRRRLRCSPPRPTATPPTCSSPSARRRARVPLQLLRVGPFRSEAGSRGRRRGEPGAAHRSSAVEPCTSAAGTYAVAPRDAHGRGDLRAGRAPTTSTAMRTLVAARRRRGARGRLGVRRGVEEPPTEPST